MINFPKDDITIRTVPVNRPAVTAPSEISPVSKTEFSDHRTAAETILPPVSVERRKTERRQQQRRQEKRGVMLDTRSKRERRRTDRRRSGSFRETLEETQASDNAVQGIDVIA